MGKDTQAIQSLAVALRDERTQNINALIAVLEKSFDKQNKTLVGEGGAEAARLLGELRATEAVKPLVDIIDIGPMAVWEKSIESMFPCYAALVEIGKPASRECLKRLTTEKVKEGAENWRSKGSLLLRVVRNVEGDDVARFMLQNAIDKEQDKDKKANLTAALGLLEKRIKEEEERAKGGEHETLVPPATTPPATTTAPAP